jgi:hypothetical protein
MFERKMSLVAMSAALLLQGCQSGGNETSVRSTSTQTETTTAAGPAETSTTNGSAAEPGTATTSSTTEAAGETVEMDNYRFRLSPDIQKNGEAHLDFYVRDLKDVHVKGVTGTFHITMPDGSKETLTMEEEKPHDHYHGKLMLKQYGEYKIAAQVNINGQKYNPRFSFQRSPGP